MTWRVTSEFLSCRTMSLTYSHTYCTIYRNDNPAIVNGTTLSIATLTAVARYHARVRVDESSELKERILKGRAACVEPIEVKGCLHASPYAGQYKHRGIV